MPLEHHFHNNVTTNAKHLHDNFYLVCCISNPCMYKSRYRLYFQFRKHIEEELGIKNFYTVEMAFADRQFVVTEPDNLRHIRVNGNSEVWLKENMFNIALARLPKEAKYIAFVDADVRFLNQNIVCDTIHALQHYNVVQMFESVFDLGPRGEICQVHKSFAYCYNAGAPYPYGKKGHYHVKGNHSFHPGFSAAFRREVLEGIGGFLDKAVLGSGDNHMWLCFIGKGQDSIPGGIHPEYRKMVMDYQAKCDVYVQKNIGSCPGTIVHSYHGKKSDRRYRERWSVLIENQYNPVTDVTKNLHGILELTGNKHKLRDDIRKYFRERNEDYHDTSDFIDKHA
jgi:hypothetical protein